MESLIPVINDLQTVFHKTGLAAIQLPQIVVVGSQSCGKSSVLESLVKKSFLPRGSGIVTRCPVILQLNHSANEEYCSFVTEFDADNTETTNRFDFNEVQAEIEERTDQLAGSNRGISIIPIIIKVHSPSVINLTVVDLPGIVKVPVGDQPEDIEEQVRNLIEKYIGNPQAIILAVSPANADIATSESIKLAKEVDPEGKRTLGVITKLDLMDKGTNANNVLEGTAKDTIKLKLGMIGVVNRSQQDILDQKDVNEALQYEQLFINEHYPELKHRLGSQYLATRLQNLLKDHITQTLPDLKKRVDSLTEEYELKLNELGQAVENSLPAKILFLVRTINDFLENIERSVEGRHDLTEDRQQLFAVSISSAFDKLRQSLNSSHMSDSDRRIKIRAAMKNSVNIERFASVEQVFKFLVKQEIKRFEEPAMTCCQDVHTVMEKMIKHHLKQGRFQNLNNVIEMATRKVLSMQLKATKNAVSEHFTIESNMICSSEERFVQLLEFNKDTPEQNMVLPETSVPTKRPFHSFPLTTITQTQARNSIEVNYVNNLIVTYLGTLSDKLADFIPKCIMHHLYRQSINGKVMEAIKSATFGKEDVLVSEPEEVLNRRLEASRMLEVLAVYGTLRSIVIMELVVDERCSMGFGFSIMFMGVAALLENPIAGLIKEMTESYQIPFIVFGCLICLSKVTGYQLRFLKNMEKSTLRSCHELADVSHL